MFGKRTQVLPYVMILPNIILYVVFILVPVIWTIYLSFTDFSIMGSSHWVGLANFKSLLKDSVFGQSLLHTAVFWIFTVIPIMFLGMVLANFLNMKIRQVAIFRGAIYLPAVISSIAVSMTWLWLLDPRIGPLNTFLNKLGFSGANWLQDTKTALMSIIFIGIWTGVGYAMILYLAGLQGIPAELYEAAKIDGAGSLRQFISITFPMLRPITFFLFVTMTIKSFQVFDWVFILTGGGPANATTTIVNEIVKSGFQEYHMGYAAAKAIVLLIITLIITIINYSVGSKGSDID